MADVISPFQAHPSGVACGDEVWSARRGASPLYAAMRRDRVIDSARQAEVVQRVGQFLMPLLDHLPGCVACYVIAGDDGSVVAAGIYRERDEAEQALRQMATWSEVVMAMLVEDHPDTLIGEIAMQYP